MALGFTYRLEREDGTPADPSTFKTAATSWRPGDTIPLGRKRMLRGLYGPTGTSRWPNWRAWAATWPTCGQRCRRRSPTT
jgi:hypothetical protein